MLHLLKTMCSATHVATLVRHAYRIAYRTLKRCSEGGGSEGGGGEGGGGSEGGAGHL